MRISELIERLEALREHHGDLIVERPSMSRGHTVEVDTVEVKEMPDDLSNIVVVS
jgi:hypothetical protein